MPKPGYRFDCARHAGESEVQSRKPKVNSLWTLDFRHWTFQQLLRKEKDEASPTIRFRQDSLNAFIPRFAGDEGFFVARPRPRSRPRIYFGEDEDEDEDEKDFVSALVSQPKNRPRENYFRADKIERSA
jgi:hypothetical protein